MGPSQGCALFRMIKSTQIAAGGFLEEAENVVRPLKPLSGAILSPYGLYTERIRKKGSTTSVGKGDTKFGQKWARSECGHLALIKSLS